MAAHGYKVHKIPLDADMTHLWQVDPYGGYFLCETYSNGVLISCFSKMARGQNKRQPIAARCFIPYNNPCRLNTIFTRLRFHRPVFRYSFYGE